MLTGSCYLYSSHTAMVCPLCQTTVPADTEHRCEVKPAEPAKPKRKRRP